MWNTLAASGEILKSVLIVLSFWSLLVLDWTSHEHFMSVELLEIYLLRKTISYFSCCVFWVTVLTQGDVFCGSTFSNGLKYKPSSAAIDQEAEFVLSDVTDDTFHHSSSLFFQAGKFSFIQLIIYIGSTLSYYALVRDHTPAGDAHGG